MPAICASRDRSRVWLVSQQQHMLRMPQRPLTYARPQYHPAIFRAYLSQSQELILPPVQWQNHQQHPTPFVLHLHLDTQALEHLLKTLRSTDIAALMPQHRHWKDQKQQRGLLKAIQNCLRHVHRRATPSSKTTTEPYISTANIHQPTPTRDSDQSLRSPNHTSTP